jgi:hypothetical protein
VAGSRDKAPDSRLASTEVFDSVPIYMVQRSYHKSSRLQAVVTMPSQRHRGWAHGKCSWTVCFLDKISAGYNHLQCMGRTSPLHLVDYSGCLGHNKPEPSPGPCSRNRRSQATVGMSSTSS